VSRHAKRSKRRPASARPARAPAPRRRAAATATPPPRPRRNPATELAARTARGKPAEQRPRAPWHPVPLAELCVLLGIVLMVLGVVHGLGSGRGRLLLVFGMAMGSLGGLDTAAREHFAGWASHTAALAGVPAVAAAGVLYFLHAPWIAIVAGAAALFVVAAVALDRAWRRASG
jgi:hypothetical protein